MKSFPFLCALRLLLLCAAFVVSSFPFTPAAHAQASFAAPPIVFNIAMPRPWTHLMEVEMRVPLPAGAAPATDLAMPVWTPGSYLVREYARNVQDFTAADESGKPLSWHKTNKNTWRVETKNAKTLVARYRVYANVLTVREAELNDSHAFWNNAAILMHVPGRLQTPATVRVDAPKEWKIATGLPAVAGETRTFSATDFDTLYDSPFEVGPFDELTFTVRGVPHRMVIEGKNGKYDKKRLQTDLAKLVETTASLFGDAPLPYRDYTFIVNLRSGNGGGLEHRNSTALQTAPRNLSGDNYLEFLSLCSHEFFHLWNVKRIRPDALGPFDYSNENYTRLLWVAEGITSYYENRHLLRAGFFDWRVYLAVVSGDIARLEQTPGRKVMSVEEASFDAWIKQYRPDENSINSQVNYYTKGNIVGLILDLTIRQRTDGAKSLDDVMRTLYTDFALKNRNYTSADFQKVCEQVAGGSLETLFSRYVRGRDEIDYDTAFAPLGLRLIRAVPNLKPGAYLGADFTASPAGVVIRSVRAGTPAYDQGLNANDLIVAINDERVQTVSDITARVGERSPGDTIRVTLFRADSLRTVEIKLGGQVWPDFRLAPLPTTTATQKRLFKGWTGGGTLP